MLHHTITAKKQTTVLLLHGYGEDSRMWEYFMRGLSDRYQILRIDLPGFGKSRIEDAVSIADMAAGVKEVIDKLKIKQFIFIGHSMGGYVGLEFAKKYPELLLGLSLFHSHPFADTAEMKKARVISAKLAESSDQAAYVRRLFGVLFPEGYKNDKLIEKMVRRAAKYPLKGLTNGQLAMGQRTDNSAVLTQLDCPVQYIIGTEDKAVPEKARREQVHLAQTADIHILEGFGHMGMFEDSRRTKKIVSSFIDFCEYYNNK
jgi:pimeloyl-ACP methyl ester carboxylesterase